MKKVSPVPCNMTKSSILDMCTLSEHEYGFLPIQQYCMLKKNKSRVAMRVGCPLSCVKIDPCDYFLSEEEYIRNKNIIILEQYPN